MDHFRQGCPQDSRPLETLMGVLQLFVNLSLSTSVPLDHFNCTMKYIIYYIWLTQKRSNLIPPCLWLLPPKADVGIESVECFLSLRQILSPASSTHRRSSSAVLSIFVALETKVSKIYLRTEIFIQFRLNSVTFN